MTTTGKGIITMERIKAWHFLPMDGKTQHRNRRLVEIGKTYSCRGNIELCVNGMHGSRRILDALQYASGSIVCEVDIWGDVKEQEDKLAGRHRKVLRMADISDVLHRFACQCATDALTAANVTDRRCGDAIDMKLRWLDGNATDAELDAAGYAARAAAAAVWYAAGDAAGYAARNAAWAAARDAAGNAAWAAARDAAGNAAWSAARSAAWNAAGYAARNAARAAQNKTLTRMVESVL